MDQRRPTDVNRLPVVCSLTVHRDARVEVLALARQEGLTVYDAAYLELALREGLPIATLDTQLKAAAARVGVTEFDPS
jgi:predicted nucleic acid-binding protein